MPEFSEMDMSPAVEFKETVDRPDVSEVKSKRASDTVIPAP